MKKLLIPLLLLLPLHAYAIDKFYIEGQITRFNPSKVDSETYTGNINGVASSANLVTNYDKDTAAGLEVGIKFKTNNRIAFSYTKLNLK